MATIYSTALLEVAKSIRLLESKQPNPTNVGNWITQCLGNDRVKNSVSVTAEATKKLAFSIENFQPARVLDNTKPETLWANVAESTPAEYLGLLEAQQIPAAIEAQECFALLAYFVTSNVYGKMLSGVSGGRAYLASVLLDKIQPKSLLITIHNVTVGGNKKDTFDLPLSLQDVRDIAQGGLWRVNLVLALKDGKRAVSSNNRPILVGW